MFIVELTYKAPLKAIDKAMAAHMKFLEKHYAAGHFLVCGERFRATVESSSRSGRAAPRLKRSPARIRSTCAASPRFDVIEFRPSQRADDMPPRSGD